MGKEIDLLKKYPETKRDLSKRLETKNDEDRLLARKFGKDFFDGDRKNGYGGFYYHPRFWKKVVKDFENFYSLNSKSKILDIGCAKGFMLHDFKDAIDGIEVAGIDISDYAINNSLPTVKKHLKVGCATKLPYNNKEFDLVISITTLHNLEVDQLKKALNEIKRVSKKSFITVDAFRNEDEKKRMDTWNLTAKTYMSTDEWVQFFQKHNYTGDYYWFIP